MIKIICGKYLLYKEIKSWKEINEVVETFAKDTTIVSPKLTITHNNVEQQANLGKIEALEVDENGVLWGDLEFTDEKFKDISSLSLLKETLKIIPGKVINMDATIVAEEPKMAPYINSMRKNIAKVIGIDISKISIKAKTNEGLGSIGKNEAIASYCVSLCEEVNK